jgi:hypothetical protein
MRRERLVFALILLSCLGRLGAQTASLSVPGANPARPTVSTPATLPPVGYVQIENGVLGAEDSPEFDIRLGVNQVTKLTVWSRLELFVQTEPLVHSTAGTDKEIHPGEVFAGVQGILLPASGTRPTIAVSYIRRLYESPAPELDIGTFRQSGVILISGELSGFHFDVNGIVSEQPQRGVRRAQYGQTLSISHPLKALTISGEVWHFSQPFLKGNAVGNLWAASYPIRRNLIIDVGVDHGLTGTSTAWEGFAGFTYLLPHRLWKPRHKGG